MFKCVFKIKGRTAEFLVRQYMNSVIMEGLYNFEVYCLWMSRRK